jgi:hypothetical protein
MTIARGISSILAAMVRLRRSLSGAMAALTLLVPAAAASEDLGRLFFTPRERQELDRRRLSKVEEEAPAVPVDASRVTVNGHVSQSSGKTTTWINGVPQYDTHKSRESNRIFLEDGALKIGQTRDRARGEVSDNLKGGEVQVHRTPPR